MTKADLRKFLNENLSATEYSCVYQFMSVDECWDSYEDRDFRYIIEGLVEMVHDCASDDLHDSYGVSEKGISDTIDQLSYYKTLLIAARKLIKVLDKQDKEKGGK